jgi:hypothetical protein
MTLQRKGTRKIVVNDRAYRWRVSSADGQWLAIVVEGEQGEGQRMVSQWYDYRTAISPGLVREVVLRALENGWEPDRRGPERVFRTA